MAVNGLANFRAKQAEEKRLKMAELAFYRLYAETVERDGREFTLVRIPDLYDMERPEQKAPVTRRGRKRQVAA